MNIDDHIEEVEKYGFSRDLFPLKYNGHQLLLLSNDACIDKGERIKFDFTLYCPRCDEANGVAGRFPDDVDRQKEYVVNAKLGALFDFYEETCRGGRT